MHTWFSFVKWQPRATVILASIILLNDVGRLPSYGDKEHYFVANPVSFSDFVTCSAGDFFRNHGAIKLIVCGSATHDYSEKFEGTFTHEVSLLYMNTDHVMKYKPKKSSMYHSAARPCVRFLFRYIRRLEAANDMLLQRLKAI
ncbi:hypothetical protein DD237_002123 [Peronospora effusa]|uniref:Uncharacterized protein n=1 Tax=Peronospora effusa TaxID=542832 RepID=A0A3R7XNU0_9STRA|nr:hypothetical protein DD237_002123 [Peronospora effusa]